MVFDQDSDDDCWMEVATPVITFPANGQTGIGFALGITVATSSFVPQILGITLGSTEYEIRTSPTGPVVGSGASTLNTSVIIPGISMTSNTLYYLRVRHVTASYGPGIIASSPWTDFITFTTGAL